MAWRGETEDGLGWGGLVPSKAEQRAEARQAALEKDAQRYRKLCDVPGALDAFTAAYHNTQTKAQIDAAVDGAQPVV